MAGAQAGAVVAVEILVEQDVIAEVRIGLEFLSGSESRPAAVLIAQERCERAGARAPPPLAPRFIYTPEPVGNST